jgi:chromosome partitioning protein
MTSDASVPTHRIIAITNQKGGVGKTTTTINLGAALAERGRRVLIVDLDPQGNASTGLGLGPQDRDLSTYDLLFPADDIATPPIRPTAVAHLSIIPANTDLASADLQLSSRAGRMQALRTALQDRAIAQAAFDYILIDCPPSLNLLTLNALVASDAVLIPLQAEFFALEGLSQLMLTVREVRQNGNPDLRLEGVVITMFDGRNRLAQQVEEDVRGAMGPLVFKTRIPRNVRLSEAPSFAAPVLVYDTLSKGSVAYRGLAAEVDARREAPANTERTKA